MSRLLAVVKRDPTLPYHAATAGAVIVTVVAAVLQGAVGPSAGIAAVVLVPAGFVFSYVRRGKPSRMLKALLAAGLLLAFGAFLGAVRSATSVDDTREPLVALFLWVQVLHSFDVPRMRDLGFSLASCVTLIALAGSLSFSTGFIVLVLLFAALFVASLVLGHRAELYAEADYAPAHEVTVAARGVQHERPARSIVRLTAPLVVATLLVTSVVFVLLPRVEGAQLAALPFALARRAPVPGFTGEVARPGEARRGEGGGQGRAAGFDPSMYFGYGDGVDLRVRGRLSDELVLRVRSPRPALYRAQAYDRYTDGNWSSTDTDLQTLTSNGDGSLSVPHERGARTRNSSELVQTFYVERALPNVLFHAYRADQVYVASTRVQMDRASSLRLPFFLEEDTIYSVISRVPSRSGEELRLAGTGSRAGLDAYLQLPPTVSDRFRNLSNEITGPHATTFDKVAAVERWLRTNKRYRLDIPRDPPGADPVEVFTFERDEGFCEQIASTMALMLRASGVPTRLMTGFGPGERNLFTGYWEVRNSDAHAWVEVYYPGWGWIQYDPTFGVPQASAANSTFMFAPLGRIASSIIPAGVLRGVGSVFSAAARAIPVTVAVILGGVLMALLLVAYRRGRQRVFVDEREHVVKAWLDLERALRKRGYTRARSETVCEFGRRVDAIESGDVTELAEAFGRVRYGAPDIVEAESPSWQLRAADAVRSIRRGRERVRV